MYSLGITPSVIALKLNISVTTIFTHLRRAKEKFELDSLSEIKTVFLMRVTTQILEKLSMIELNGGSQNG